jgi:hypothetical protein
MFTLFCRSFAAIFTSVPTLKTALILLCPLEVLLLLIYDMPGVPFICVSIGVVVVSSTDLASAPVKVADIFTVGGVISGYWAIGKVVKDIMPTSTITIEITIAVTGRLIKVSAIIFKYLFW